MSFKYHKINYLMKIAEAVSEQSPDAETKVGAVLVKNNTNAIVATGYNGFLRQAPDKLLPTTRPNKYEYIIHAEQNLIYNCAKTGVSTDNTTLICTMSPCSMCMRSLWQCGVTEVICKDLYSDHDVTKQLKDIDLDVSRYDEYYVLTFKPKGVR
jgi:dCMP deaminase